MIKWIKRIFKKGKQHKGSIQLPSLPDSNIWKVKEFALNGWELGDTHGISHWQRVERNGIILSTENGTIRNDINIKVVRLLIYMTNAV